MSAQVHISSGNIKLGRILNVNLPPILSCVRDVPCQHQGCYALKAWRMYPNVRRAWLENLNILTQSRDAYFSSIIDQLRSKRTAVPFFRWHSSGDIVDQNYLDYMCQVAREFPLTRFLAFTKRNSLDVSALPDNLVIRYSFWPDYKPIIDQSFSTFAGLVGDDRITGYICPGDCRTCKKCWSRVVKNVVFHKH